MARSVLSRRLASLSEETSWLRYVGWFVDGPALLLFWGVCALLPPPAASRLGAAVLGFFGPRTHKHKHVLANLTVALRGAAPTEIQLRARAVWRGLGMVMAEYPHLGRIGRTRMTVHIAPGAAAIFKAGQRAIFVTAHVGNWELGAPAITQSGARLAAIYSKQSNPLANWAIQRCRSVFPCDYLPKENAMRTWLRMGSDGPALALMVDQRVDGGELMMFFGSEGETVTTPARLAARNNVPLIPFRVIREGLARYSVQFEEPIPRPDGSAAAAAMMRALLNRFEAWIRERPDEWMCTKRRWPKQRGERAHPREVSAAGAPSADDRP